MRFSEIINEITRRDFLKGAGATTFSAILPNITNATTRETAISNIASIAGTIHDMQKLGWSRSQIIKDFERRNTGPDLMKVVTIVASMAFVYPKGYLTRAEFVRMVEQQARQNLPDDPGQVARKKAETDRINREYNANRQRDQEERRQAKEIADTKQRQQQQVENYIKDIKQNIRKKLDFILPNVFKKLKADSSIILNFKNQVDCTVELSVDQEGNIKKFMILKNLPKEFRFYKYGISDLYTDPRLYSPGKNLNFNIIPPMSNELFKLLSSNESTVDIKISFIPLLGGSFDDVASKSESTGHPGSVPVVYIKNYSA
jgi:hypothetical protein